MIILRRNFYNTTKTLKNEVKSVCKKVSRPSFYLIRILLFFVTKNSKNSFFATIIMLLRSFSAKRITRAQSKRTTNKYLILLFCQNDMQFNQILFQISH